MASIISLGIQAKYKIGFGKKRSREGQWLFVNRRIQDPETPHVLDGFMAFADYLGVPPAEMLSWQLAISDSDREYAKQFIDPTRKNLIIFSLSLVKPRKMVGGALCGSGKYCSST